MFSCVRSGVEIGVLLCAFRCGDRCSPVCVQAWRSVFCVRSGKDIGVLLCAFRRGNRCSPVCVQAWRSVFGSSRNVQFIPAERKDKMTGTLEKLQTQLATQQQRYVGSTASPGDSNRGTWEVLPALVTATEVREKYCQPW